MVWYRLGVAAMGWGRKLLKVCTVNLPTHSEAPAAYYHTVHLTSDVSGFMW